MKLITTKRYAVAAEDNIGIIDACKETETRKRKHDGSIDSFHKSKYISKRRRLELGITDEQEYEVMPDLEVTFDEEQEEEEEEVEETIQFPEFKMLKKTKTVSVDQGNETKAQRLARIEAEIEEVLNEQVDSQGQSKSSTKRRMTDDAMSNHVQEEVSLKRINISQQSSNVDNVKKARKEPMEMNQLLPEKPTILDVQVISTNLLAELPLNIPTPSLMTPPQLPSPTPSSLPSPTPSSISSVSSPLTQADFNVGPLFASTPNLFSTADEIKQTKVYFPSFRMLENIEQKPVAVEDQDQDSGFCSTDELKCL